MSQHNSGMMMHFGYGTNVGPVLFESWVVNDGLSYAVCIFFCFSFSLLNQFLFWIVRKKITYKTKEGDQPIDNFQDFKKYFWFILKPILFLLQNSLSYFLMLIVMTFNFGIFASIVLGNTIGWILFSLRDTVVPEDNCH